MARHLSNYTKKCTISFLDLYRKTERNLRHIHLEPIHVNDMIEIASEFSKIAGKYGLVIETCSEDINLNDLGIRHGKCIDADLISTIAGKKISIDRDPNQRKGCDCVKSIDVGAYNTCRHQCLYCYANFSEKMVYNNSGRHNPTSPLLYGELEESDKIIHRN